MFLDFVDITRLRKAIIYFALVLLSLLLQNIVLSRIEILGVKAMILPLIAVAVGFFEGGVWGGVFGLILGFFTDMSLNGAAVMMTVLFPVLGFTAGALTTFFMNKKLNSFFFVGVGALILTAFCQSFSVLVFSDTDKLAVLLVILIQCLLSLPFVFAVYYPCRRLSGLDLSK